MFNRMRVSIFALVSLLGALIIIMVSHQQSIIRVGSQFRLTQTTPTVPLVMPEALGRLSWGAVIAGVIIALMIQLALNLLGIAIGTTQLDPYDKTAPSAKALTSSAAVWIGLSVIVSLVAGGWLAARFAGIPDNTDGMLHGLMVWGLVTLVTILLISSAVGRLLSGVNLLFQHTLDLVGQVTGTLAQGAATVVQAGADAVQAGAGVAQGAVERAADATKSAVDSGADVVRQQADSHPAVRQALQSQNTSMSSIESEIQALIRQAGIPQQQVSQAVDAAKSEVKEAAGQAVQQAQQGDLQQAAQTLVTAVQTVLEQGRDATQQVDRENVVNLLASRTGMSREAAAARLDEWQGKAEQARQQAEQVPQQVSEKLDQAKAQVEQVQTKAAEKVEEVKAQTEAAAKEAANQARKSLGKVALALFAALLIGAIAAGIGGSLGAPHELPSATVNSAAFMLPF